MRRIAVLLLATACSIPGIAPEGRDVRITHQEIAAAPAAVHDRAVETLTRLGYTITASSPAQFVRGEKALEAGRVNIIEARTRADGATRAELHGWTDLVTAVGRQKTSQYDESVSRDMLTLSENLSCPAARWPDCP